MVGRVALFGGPGAGKTTLAKSLAGELKSRGLRFDSVDEYAREWINKYGAEEIAACGPMLQYKFAAKQLAKEESIASSCSDGWVTDSPLFLGWAYAVLYARSGDDGRLSTASYHVCKDCYKNFISAMGRYTHFIHLEPFGRMQEDGVRRQTQDEVDLVDRFLLANVEAHLRPLGKSVIHLSSESGRLKRLLEILSQPTDIHDARSEET